MYFRAYLGEPAIDRASRRADAVAWRKSLGTIVHSLSAREGFRVRLENPERLPLIRRQAAEWRPKLRPGKTDPPAVESQAGPQKLFHVKQLDLSKML